MDESNAMKLVELLYDMIHYNRQWMVLQPEDQEVLAQTEAALGDFFGGEEDE